MQVFDNDLNLKAIYDNVGSPWAVCISPGPHQYLFVSNSMPDNGNPRGSRRSHRRDLQDGARRHDRRQVRQGRQGAEEFSTVHEIDCRNPNELFVSEITDWRAQKIMLKPAAGASRPAGGAK